MSEEPVLAEEYDLENSEQFKKARQLIENEDIKIQEAYVDEVKFKINGNNGDYTLHYNPQSKEALCNCKGEKYNDGDCYHKIAAPILLTRKVQ